MIVHDTAIHQMTVEFKPTITLQSNLYQIQPVVLKQTI